VPELIEVEIYRRQAEGLVGRKISAVSAPDEWFLKGATTPAALLSTLVGSLVTRADRIGKLLVLEVVSGHRGANGESAATEAGERSTLGLRFGMTGRLVVDGMAEIDELLYSTSTADHRFVRFGLSFDDGGEMSMIDPRRLGGVEIAPDITRLGPDAATLSARQLRDAISRSTIPVKARLLDQSRVAGVGNLIADETFWRAGVDPTRSCASFEPVEVTALAARIRSTIKLLTKRGGSHTGDLQDHRHRDGRCPRDGASLKRDEIGGRTTYWCPVHQL